MGEGSFAYRLLDSKENVIKKYEIVAESAFSSPYASFFVLNRMKKMEMLSKVAKMLDVNLSIVKDDGKEYSEPQMFSQSKSSREHFSLNGSEPYNKRRFVLEAVKLFMGTYPTATFNDITEAFQIHHRHPCSAVGHQGNHRQWQA